MLKRKIQALAAAEGLPVAGHFEIIHDSNATQFVGGDCSQLVDCNQYVGPPCDTLVNCNRYQET
jgi:hypothetical protein